MDKLIFVCEQMKFDELKKAAGVGAVAKAVDVNKYYVQAVEHITQNLLSSVMVLHPAKVWDDISPQLYVTFWTLSLYDLHVPVDCYETEISKLQQIADEADANAELTSSKKKKERERCEMIIKRLQDERTVQQENHRRVIARLQHEKESWFNNRSQKNRMITQLLQLCIFPRCCFTALDAVYCGEFIHTLHTLKTPNFSTLLFYDRVFSDVARTITCCTENEASRYGKITLVAVSTRHCYIFET
jgi:THO complex subunit 2